MTANPDRTRLENVQPTEPTEPTEPTGSMKPTLPVLDAGTAQLLGEQLRPVVRAEIDAAIADVRRRARLYGAAAITALYGAGALVACVILALAHPLPGWLAALVVGAALVVVAALLASGAKEGERIGAEEAEERAPEAVSPPSSAHT